MTEIITTHDELVKLVKDGNFFGLCVSIALNKGYKDVIKARQEVKFNIGDYEVKFNGEQMCFEICHKIYFARILVADFHGTNFIGDDIEEVKTDILTELKKEK